jgi:hypothetical protein
LKIIYEVKKDFQTIIDELRGKYIALVKNNVPCGCFVKDTKLGKSLIRVEVSACKPFNCKWSFSKH